MSDHSWRARRAWVIGRDSDNESIKPVWCIGHCHAVANNRVTAKLGVRDNVCGI